MYCSKKQKIVTYLVFGLYLLLLIWTILFKLCASVSELDRIQDINLIPFYYDTEVSSHWSEVFYNVIIFIPLGVYMGILRAKRPVWVRILYCSLVSVFFEVIQYVFAIGSSDITDIITNTFGGIIGILLFALLKKLFCKRYLSIINTIGLTAEIIMIAMQCVLLLSNM